MSLIRRRIMMKNANPNVDSDDLLSIGTINPSYVPYDNAEYGFDMDISGNIYNYYDNTTTPYLRYNSDNDYSILGSSTLDRNGGLTKNNLPIGIMSEVDPLVTKYDSTESNLARVCSIVSNIPIYVVRATIVGGVTKYKLAYKKKVGTVDENYVPYDSSKTYGFTITISGNTYYYYSNSPFFVRDNGDDTYNILCADDAKRYPNQTFSTLSSGIMSYVNSDIIRYEQYSRNKTAIDTIVSNHPIYIVKDVNGSKYFYENKTRATLPSGYTELQYVTANGTQYINTELNEEQTSHAKYKASFSQGSHIGSGHILSSQNLFIPFLRRDSSYNRKVVGRKFYGTETPSTGDLDNFTWDWNKTYEIEGYKNGDVIINGVTVGTLQQGSTSSASNPLYLFTRGGQISNTDYRFWGNFYSGQIYDSNDTLIRNYIPCKNSNDVVGLYDTVTGTFYHSDSGTELIAGTIA